MVVQYLPELLIFGVVILLILLLLSKLPAPGVYSEDDAPEASATLERELGRYHRYSYSELCSKIGETEDYETRSLSGLDYAVEISVIWDAKPGGNIRVMGCIDGQNISSAAPLATSFIMAPDGTCDY